MGLCKYAIILGEPGKGVHSFRILNFAVFDILATVLLGYFASKLFKTDLKLTVLVCFIVGIISHRVFCVKTTADRLIFG
jgi:hypothetical protein